MTTRYDALISLWPTLSGSTEEKIAAVNTMTVAGPRRDVTVSSVLSYLALHGDLNAIKNAAANPPANAPAQLTAAVIGFVTIITTPEISSFRMSDPKTYAAVKAMADALVAGGLIAQQHEDDLLAMAETTIPWWQANGLTSTISQNDLDAISGLMIGMNFEAVPPAQGAA